MPMRYSVQIYIVHILFALNPILNVPYIKIKDLSTWSQPTSSGSHGVDRVSFQRLFSPFCGPLQSVCRKIENQTKRDFWKWYLFCFQYSYEYSADPLTNRKAFKQIK